MKYLNKYFQFFETAQSKKIKKYISYSTVLEWYNKNKKAIANILGCDPLELVDEDTLMTQSYDLVNSVINTQTGGNEGRPDDDIVGFSEFKKLEKNLIHDILHNMYNVKRKEFNKSVSDIQYTESEIMEEIECLGIEESFMKYMNINYLKSDFINANINQLASFLMMAILKNDPIRIQKILDKEIEPYLEVYGKKYPTEGTPYENFFKLFDNTTADSSFRIKDSDDLKDYMIKLINVDSGIRDSGGDRAQYPGSDYFGQESWHNINDSRKREYIELDFDIRRYGNSQYYLIKENEQLNLSDLNFKFTLTGEKRKKSKTKTDEEIEIINKKNKERNVLNKLEAIRNKLNFKLEEWSERWFFENDFCELSLYDNNIDYDNEEIYVHFLNKETKKEYEGYIKIDKIPLYVTHQLKLENMNINNTDFSDREELKSIPIKKEVVDTDGDIDMEEWFKYIKTLFSDEDIIVDIDENKFIGIEHNKEKDTYTILTNEEFENYISERFNNNSTESLDTDTEFIDIKEYEKKSFEEIARILMAGNDSVAIMRRNFRVRDVIKNNTKLGNLNYRDADPDVITKEIVTKNRLWNNSKKNKNNYIDFEASDFSSEKSVSKIILTENGKKLVEVLNNLRGYLIKNFNKIKSTYKKNTQKFKPEDITTYKKIDLRDLQSILNTLATTKFSENKISLNFSIGYGWSSKSSNVLTYTESSQIAAISKFTKIFKNIVKFRNLIKSKRDLDFLKNFVNEKGLLKTTKDFDKFRELVQKISKFDKLISNYKFTHIIDAMDSTFRNKDTGYYSEGKKILIPQDLNDRIKKCFNERGEVINNETLIELIKLVVEMKIPGLNVINIDIRKAGTYHIDFTAEVN